MNSYKVNAVGPALVSKVSLIVHLKVYQGCHMLEKKILEILEFHADP